MNMDISTLPDDTSELKELLQSLVSTHTDLEKQYQASQDRIHCLEERIRLLQNEIFGRKSEKRSAPEADQQQLCLFDETESAVGKATDECKEEITVPAHTRKKPGRKPLPEDLPRIDVIHDLPEDEKVCGCGCEMSKIGEVVSEKLDIIPARMQVIRHIRYKYDGKKCEGMESDGPPVKIAPKGIATPGLMPIS